MIDQRCPLLIGCLFVGYSFIPKPVAAQQLKREMTGSITTRDGNPIQEVVVVTSGQGFNGWATSKADGSFRLAATGAFVSFRHEDYKPVLLRSIDLTNPVSVQLEPADETVWQLRSCASLPGRGAGWIGGGLRVNAAGKAEGPVNGELVGSAIVIRFLPHDSRAAAQFQRMIKDVDRSRCGGHPPSPATRPSLKHRLALVRLDSGASLANRLLIVPVSRGKLEANRARSAKYNLRNVLLQKDREVAQAYAVEGPPAAVLIKDGKIASPVAAAIGALVTRAAALSAAAAS